MWYVQIIIMIAAYFLSAMLAPKQKSKPTAFEDIDFPAFDEGSPQEVYFGDVWTESWMVLGVGNYRTTKIRDNGQTIGHRYYMGIHMGLARGPLDEIIKIEVGGKVLWTGSVTTNSTVAINLPTLFGGKKREGGMVGSLQFLMGGTTQVATAELSTMLGGGIVPGFRGVTTMFYDGGIGNSAYPKTWAMRCRRIAQGWHNDTCWYSAKATVLLESSTIKAMNPAHILYECLTNPQWGRGFAAVKMDDAAWRAAADALHAEGFGLCLRWKRQDKIRNFIQSVLDHCGGALYTDRETGLITFKLIRGDYVAASLPLFDFDNGLLSVQDDQSASQTAGTNEVIVKYYRPITNEDGQVRAQNLGAQYSNGKISQTVEYPGLPTPTLAIRCAQRDLKTGSGFLKRYTLLMDRRAYDMAPASVFRFTDPSRGIVDMVVRVGKIEESEDGGTLTITVLQDTYGLDSTVYVTDTGNTSSPATPFAPPETSATTAISVLSATTTAPPGSPVDGDMYLVPTGATGAWSALTGQLVTWNSDTSVWDASVLTAGTLIWDTSTSSYLAATGAAIAAPPWSTGAIQFLGVLSPAAITANQNNYNPTGLSTASALRLSTNNAPRTITGLAGGTAGRLMIVHNVDPNLETITLADEDVGSTAANRFALSAPIALSVDSSVLLQYDAVSSRWRAIGGAGGGSSSPTTTLGDIIVRGASSDARLGVGSAGQVLTIVAGVPAWATPAAATTMANDALWDAAGDLAVGTGANAGGRLAVGSETQVLTVVSGLPAWAAAPAGGGGGGSSMGALAFVGEAVIAGAAATDLTISGLDLDADDTYVIHLEAENASGSTSAIAMFYNGDTTATNYDNQRHSHASTTQNCAGANTADIIHTGNWSATGGEFVCRMTLSKGIDARPVAVMQSISAKTGAAFTGDYRSHRWRTASTNVTSITFRAAVASAFAVGSRVRVWKLGVGGIESACIVTRAALQTFTTTESSVSWDTEVIDTENYFDIGTPTRITIPATGWYAVTGTVVQGGDPDDMQTLFFRKNGGAYAVTQHQSRLGLSTAVNAYTQVVDPNYYVAGDYIELRVQNRTGNSTAYARLSIVRISGPTGPKGPKGEIGGTGVMATYKRKASDTPRASTAAMADDPDLTLSLDANTIYEFEAYLAYAYSTGGGIKWTPNFTGTTDSIKWTSEQGNNGSAAFGVIATAYYSGTYDVEPAVAAPGWSAGFGSYVGYGRVRGVISVGATGGTFSMQWAQNTSNANACTVYKDSFLRVNSLTEVSNPAPTFSAQKLLMHFDGANGDTSDTDVQGRSWTQVGAATLSSAQSKFGGTSLLIPATAGPQAFETAITTALDIKGGFTFECWVYPVAIGSGISLLTTIVAGSNDAGVNREIQLWFSSATNFQYFTDQRGTAGPGLTVNFTIATLTLNTWHHVACGRDPSGITHLWVDGIYYPGSASADKTILQNSVKKVRLGKTNDGSAANFYIDEARLVFGGLIYPTYDFTPPTAAFPDTYR